MSFEDIKANSGRIKAITQGVTVTPKGLAAGQNSPTPQKFGMVGKDIGVDMAVGSGGPSTNDLMAGKAKRS